MNVAEKRRDERIEAMSDLALLGALIADEDLDPTERSAFSDMRGDLLSEERLGLSKRQRAWAEEVMRRITPIRSEDVPAGRPVATPAVLQNLPKRPPPRRHDL